ncbi:delta-class carbonic anhydrase [uncultured Ruegeria sp.]|uniref:delta-class carbonic anhydrase n=1 Tax=uncultured Ruegeria sp. TaxID=259304 RepID=UPI0026265984|nr:delta-class carbonic anhydrase [uncultured Ruegeria sp.]
MIGSAALAGKTGSSVSDEVVARQRVALGAATEGKGFGPQSPRDIRISDGSNDRAFKEAPNLTKMTLCDIHFHKSAEHRGGMFTTFVGNGDGQGNGTGFEYDGKLTKAELEPVKGEIGGSDHGDLAPGDTIEVHFVYSTADATLGNSLATCFDEVTANPQLRVEAVIGVLVNDSNAASFLEMTQIESINGLNQVPFFPENLGDPVLYAGSTTGPDYNEKGSPFQVTWSVRPEVLKIYISSLFAWLDHNQFNEDHAHGVRNLVVNPDLLSEID